MCISFNGQNMSHDYGCNIDLTKVMLVIIKSTIDGDYVYITYYQWHVNSSSSLSLCSRTSFCDINQVPTLSWIIYKNEKEKESKTNIAKLYIVLVEIITWSRKLPSKKFKIFLKKKKKLSFDYIKIFRLVQFFFFFKKENCFFRAYF